MSRAVLSVALAALASCSQPVVTASPSPSAAVAPSAGRAETPSLADTPSGFRSAAAPSASPRPVTITGSVTWNHYPQAGVTVTINELAAPRHGPARASITTAVDGTFSVSLDLPPNAAVGAFVPAHGPYLEAGRPADGSGTAMTADDIQLAREITGLSIHDGDRFRAGPLTFNWDPVPEATGYCVVVWRVNLGYQGPSCLSGAPGERVMTHRFTTTPLDPELYAVSVVAMTDVIVGRLSPRGLAFTVIP